MNKTVQGLLVVGMVLVVGLLGIIAVPKEGQSLGSTGHADLLFSTTTPSGIANADYIITTSPGAVGTIMVASSSASTFTVLDANGTNTTTVATLKAAIGEGSYILDRSLIYGLVIQVPAAFNGQYVTTYR